MDTKYLTDKISGLFIRPLNYLNRYLEKKAEESIENIEGFLSLLFYGPDAAGLSASSSDIGYRGMKFRVTPSSKDQKRDDVFYGFPSLKFPDGPGFSKFNLPKK